jgi:LasA protease
MVLAAACGPPPPSSAETGQPGENHPPPARPAEATAIRTPEGAPSAATPAGTPTPNPPHTGAPTDTYVVREGDSLFWIAQRFGCTVDDLIRVNKLQDPDSLYVGQWLRVPVGADRTGPALKLIPDSELVYGPSYVDFDLESFVEAQPGYLKNHHEKVDGQEMSGAEIIRLVMQEFSVGPRPLLALLEYRGGWLSNPSPAPQALEYPMGLQDPSRPGLFRQASWAADRLNEGYYGWQRGDLFLLHFADRQKALFAPELNPGTVGVQNVLALQTTWEQWLEDAGPEGYIKVYKELFGDPFQYAVEPLIPPDLAQPPLEFPWEKGETWYYSAGPHPAWVNGSAWAALDFFPPGEGVGCWQSDAWATAAGPGVVVRVAEGMVLEDLDGLSPPDGLEQTGWVLFYLHVATGDGIAVGTRLETGDRIGHPSCEGGQATGTHLHLARRYNGQWMAAAGPVPLVLSGWTVQPAMAPYEGDLVRGDQSRTSGEFREAGKNDLRAE